MAKIVISGFMGSGKTRIGRILSEKLNLPFYDLDEEIEKREKKSIKKIFENLGESYFREIEKRTLLDFLNQDRDFVLSIGGGTVTNDESVEDILKKSIPILLKGDLKVFYERVKGDENRPLLKNFDEFLKLYKKREKFYNKIPIKIDSDREESYVINDLISIIKRHEFDEPQKIIYELGLTLNFKREIYFSIIDEKVFKNYKERFNIKTYYLIKRGERSKNLGEYFKIINFLSEIKFEKSDTLFGIGGGVVGDISGFVSSTYMRGINFYLIPTTLLSQIDSSIGGKNGVNLKNGKNAVGTIYLPKETFIDPTFLFLLSKKEILSGLGEIFKYGILRENGIFDFLEKSKEIDFFEIISLIVPSIKEKIFYVKEDLYEMKNIRIFLNLGHTLGHALETLLGFGKITHGEAVSFGIVFSSFLSLRLKHMKEKTFGKIFNVYKKIGFKYEKILNLKNIDKERFIHVLLLDKKSKEKKLNIILPIDIGNVKIIYDFDLNDYIKYFFDFIRFLEEEI